MKLLLAFLSGFLAASMMWGCCWIVDGPEYLWGLVFVVLIAVSLWLWIRIV